MGILDRLIKWYRDRQKRKKTAEYFMIDIQPDDYSQHMLSRVEECFDETLEAHDSVISTLIRGHKYLANLLFKPFQGHDMNENRVEEIAENINLPHFRIIESLKLLEDSLLLTLSGRYTAGLSTMRTALECMVVGGFYHGLSKPEFRKKASHIRHWKATWAGYSKTFLEMVEELVENDEAAIRDDIYLESRVEKMLSEHDPPLPPPNFRRMLCQVVEWFELRAVQNPIDMIYGIYDNLSIFTHAMQDVTTYKQILLSGGTDFSLMSGIVDDKLMKKSGDMYIHILDIIGSIFFALIQDRLQTLKWEIPVLQLLENSYADGKTLGDCQTRMLLLSLSQRIRLGGVMLAERYSFSLTPLVLCLRYRFLASWNIVSIGPNRTGQREQSMGPRSLGSGLTTTLMKLQEMISSSPRSTAY
ncbi:MAG: hypothetical protein ACOC3C_06525 [Candidatus Thorarchaeota archaeon]